MADFLFSPINCGQKNLQIDEWGPKCKREKNLYGGQNKHISVQKKIMRKREGRKE